MKHIDFSVGGTVVKQDDRYVVTDNTDLNRLVLSSTSLNPQKSTSGHSHDDQEEIYFFIQGTGEMQVGDQTFHVSEGSIIQIPAGAFHRVWNTDASDKLYFVCVFEGKRNH